MQQPRPAEFQGAVPLQPSSPPPLQQVAVLIPARDPDRTLSSLVTALVEYGFTYIVLVDDGSSPASHVIFDQLAGLPAVHVLRHAANQGKGRALKTGFAHLESTRLDLVGVVTADADGQHLPADIARVAASLLSSSGRPVLGSRQFGPGVPLRSRVGNQFTRAVFAYLVGTRLADTQSGLRGLPMPLLPALLHLPGERYEYETTMLAHLCRSGAPPIEVPIQTVYLDNNRYSHFHPLWDSLRIYRVLLRSRFRRGRSTQAGSRIAQ